MAVKTATNGVIVLGHSDTVAKGSNNYRVEAVTICDPGATGATFTLYAKETASAPIIATGVTGATPINIYIGGCVPSGGGLLYTDGGGATTCHVYVK